MINLYYHAESVWQGLSLGRFHVHFEEVKRVLTPVLEEVYQIGYDRGVADHVNNLSAKPTVKEEILREVTADEMIKIENSIPIDTTYEGAESVG